MASKGRQQSGRHSRGTSSFKSSRRSPSVILSGISSSNIHRSCLLRSVTSYWWPLTNMCTSEGSIPFALGTTASVYEGECSCSGSRRTSRVSSRFSVLRSASWRNVGSGPIRRWLRAGSRILIPPQKYVNKGKSAQIGRDVLHTYVVDIVKGGLPSIAQSGDDNFNDVETGSCSGDCICRYSKRCRISSR